MALRARLRKFLSALTRHAASWWYEPAMVLLSIVDAFVPFVPNEAILAAGTIAKPRRWFLLGIIMAAGSAAGAVALAAVVGHWSSWILHHIVSHKLLHSKGWEDSMKLINEDGWWGLILIALGPIPQHAGVIFVALTGMTLNRIFWGIWIGRAAKYLIIAWLASHAPKKLRKWHLLPKEEDPQEGGE